MTQGGDSAVGWLAATCLLLGSPAGAGITPEPSLALVRAVCSQLGGGDGTGKEGPWEAACCFLVLGRGRIWASVPSSRRHTLSQLLLAEHRAAKKPRRWMLLRLLPPPLALKTSGDQHCACAWPRCTGVCTGMKACSCPVSLQHWGWAEQLLFLTGCWYPDIVLPSMEQRESVALHEVFGKVTGRLERGILGALGCVTLGEGRMGPAGRVMG